MECLLGSRLSNITAWNTTMWGVFKAYAFFFNMVFTSQTGLGLSLELNYAMADAGLFPSCFATPSTCVTGFTAAMWLDITEGECGSFAGLVTTIDDGKQGVSVYCRNADSIG